MKFKSFLILFFVLILGILFVSSVSATNTDMVQYDDYLFGIDYSEINYEAGFNYYNNSNITQSDNGECSSFFNDNIAGRSYWIDNNTTSIVITVTDAKYKNIGVAGGLFNQKDCLNIMNHKGDYSDKLEVLPFFLLDGINEAGVYCNANMVSSDKSYQGTSTIAAIETRMTIHAQMLPRFVLDNFASAKDAVEYIRDYCNVFNDPKVYLHMMIADNSSDCYVLEFFDGKVWINENQPAMTNFYVTGVKFNANGTVPTAETNEDNVTGGGNLTIPSQGLERYNIIINDYDNLNTVDDFWNTLHKLKFTNPWTSDLEAINDPLSQANKSRAEYLNDTLNRQRGDNNTWQSIHQAVYDLDNLAFYIETQEKYKYRVFELMKDTTVDVYGLDDLKVGKESEITVVVNRHGTGLPNTQVCIDIFSDKNELLYSSMGYTNDAGIFTFKYTPSVAGKQSLVVSSKVNKTVDFEVSSNETSNQTVSAGTIPMQATGNSLTIALVLFILILSLGYITYRKDNI